MLKKLTLLLLLSYFPVDLIAQLKPSPEQFEQNKRHSRVNLHEEKQLSGRIVKLLYNDAYEYLDGFILETAPGQAFKVDAYFYLGQALYPYLKRGEEVMVTVKGDKDLLTKILFKSPQDIKTEKQLGIKLNGLAHFQSIKSSHGFFEKTTFDNMELENADNQELVINARVVKSIKGKRKRIQLIIDNGDTINTYQTSRAKQHYKDDNIDYLRNPGPFAGALNKSARTYHMAGAYVSGPTIPTRHDFQMTALGQRSTFLYKTENVSLKSPIVDKNTKITSTTWESGSGEVLNIVLAEKHVQSVKDFLAHHGEEHATLFYNADVFPRRNHLRGLKIGNELILVNLGGLPKDNKRAFQGFFSNARARGWDPDTTKNVAQGRLKKFFTDGNGVYVGLAVEAASGETTYFKFFDTHGEAILSKFKVGDQVSVEAAYKAPKSFKINTFESKMGSAIVLSSPLLKGVKAKDRKEFFASSRMKFINSITSTSETLTLDNTTRRLERLRKPSEMILDVAIKNIYRKNRRTVFVLENGDTLFMRPNKGLNKGAKVSYVRTYPVVYKGQAFDQADYAEKIANAVWIKRQKVQGPLTRVYDSWMRLIGYEGQIDGSESMIRIAPEVGKAVENYLQKQATKGLILFANKDLRYRPSPPVYFFTALENEKGIRVMDNRLRDIQRYLADTVFTAKVKEVIQHTDRFAYFKTTVILENDFVFSMSNKTLGSIGPDSFVGSEITVKGKPLVPREGEVFKEEAYRLIKASQITAGSIEFKISD